MEQEYFFNCEILEEKPFVAVIYLGKSVLGGNEALEFTSHLEECSNKNIKYVIVNLQKVQMMNSSGLGMLVSGISTLRKHNITMYLADVPEKVFKLLKMTHLDEVFNTFPSLDIAIEKCS